MDFTICSRVIKTASKEYKYAFDLLMQFISDNPHKVVTNDIILNDYKNIAINSEIIRTWIEGMDYKGYWKNIDANFEDNPYINLCNSTYDKHLIVDEKEDYLPENYAGLTILNKDEAIEELKQSKITNIIKDSIVATNGSLIKHVKK